MEAVEVLKKYKTSKIIKLINKNKLNVSLEDLLMSSINYNRNDLIINLINNENIDLNYVDDIEFDFLSMAVSRGNIEALELLIQNGVDIQKKYKCGRKLVTVIYYVRDLDTLKYLESYIDKKEIKKSLESVIRSTVISYDIELLDYIITNYKINIKKIKYEIQKKKYNFLQLTEEILQSMKNREYRKREMALYISELLPSKRYKKVEKRAYEILNEIEEENKEIEEYYNYIKRKFGEKDEDISTKKFKI